MDFSLDPNFDFDDFEDGDTHKPAVADSSPAKRTDEKEYVAAQDGLSQLPLALQLLLEREHCLCYATVRELVPCSANVDILTAAVTKDCILKLRNSTITSKHPLAADESPATKILIHHEFVPCFQRYVALLRSDYSLTIFSYHQFKPVSQFSSVETIQSLSVGLSPPQLVITKLSGERLPWSPLLSGEKTGSPEVTSKAKQNVINCLSARLQDSLRQLTRMESCCKQQKVFICRQLAAVQSSLRGGGPQGDSQCTVSPLRHKVLYDSTLVLCLTLHNTHKKLCLRGVSLSLSSLDCPPLRYTCQVFKSVMRRKAGDTAPATVSVEKLSPCVLRPGKKAFVVVRCSLPVFTSRHFKINGVLRYHITGEGGRARADVHQLAVPPLTLDCLAINKARVNVCAPRPKTGVSMDSLSLLTGGQQYSALLAFPLSQLDASALLDALVQHAQLTKVEDLTGVLAFPGAGVLQHCALQLQQRGSEGVLLTIHARDLPMATLATLSVQCSIPPDTIASPSVSHLPSHSNHLPSHSNHLPSHSNHHSGMLVCLRQAISSLVAAILPDDCQAIEDANMTKKIKMDGDNVCEELQKEFQEKKSREEAGKLGVSLAETNMEKIKAFHTYLKRAECLYGLPHCDL